MTPSERTEKWDELRRLFADGKLVLPERIIDYPRPPLSDRMLALKYALSMSERFKS